MEQSTGSRDVAVVKQPLREAAIDDIRERTLTELVTLDDLERICAERFEATGSKGGSRNGWL